VRGYDISIESQEPPHPESARRRADSDLSPPGRGDSRVLRFIAAIPKIFVALLLVFVMLDLLAGVLLRYVVVQVTDYFDLDPISFFWVEEVGEFGLAWLTAIGAAVAIVERVHFALGILTHRFAPRTQRIIDRVNHLLIAAFGALAAIYGWKLCVTNSLLTSPGLGINLAWLYASSVAGGSLIALYGLAIAAGLAPAKDAAGGGP
jgi:TRAP-type C4-dicarboxylate transport system permease small subunit